MERLFDSSITRAAESNDGVTFKSCLRMRRQKNKPANAKSESKLIDFKSNFDPGRAAGWCELLKDVTAMASSLIKNRSG